MKLSEPVSRKHLHTRAITLHGYQREDGQFDIEDEITDTKAYAFNIGIREVKIGDPLHHMRARLTVDENLTITQAEAVTEAGPFTICPGGAETFGRLTGLTIKSGFIKAANERLGGSVGCTHLRELLQQMATVVFQTTFPMREKRVSDVQAERPRLLNTCHAYADTGEVVKERWPHLYKGENS